MHHTPHHRPRFSARFLLLCLAVFASLALVPAQPGSAQDAGPDAAPAAAANTAAASVYAPQVLNKKCIGTRPLTRYGVQLYGDTGFGTAYYQELLDSNASWARTVVIWSEVEPANTSPAQYNWDAADRVVDVALQDCVNLIITNADNPAWSSDFPEGRVNKVAIAELVEFIVAMVERYDGDGIDDAPGSPVVLYYELYNEPDAGPSGNTERWGLHGDDYAAMLKAVYPAVKAANPNAQVLFGGIAYDFFANPSDPVNSGPFIRSFFDDVLKNGGGPYFDLMNYHFYPFFGPNWTSNFPDDGPGLVEKTEAIRTIMRNNGVDKPVIITEMGWHNNPLIPHGDDIVQVRMVQQLYTQAIVADVPMAGWWPLADVGSTYIYDSGLVTAIAKGTPERKPAFYAYQVFNREFRDVSYVRKFDFANDVKAYQFQDNAHNRTIFVAWTNPTDPVKIWGSQTQPYVDTTRTTTVNFNASRVTIYDAFWQNLGVVNDGDDGRMDGKVRVTINGNPRYIIPG